MRKYERKTFDEFSYAVYEGDTFVKRFRYLRVAKRYVARQPNSDMWTVKTERNNSVPAAEEASA